MPSRTRSDAFLRSIGPRKLTNAEHRAYVLLSIEEGSLDSGEGITDRLLARLRRKREGKPATAA
jgi:hypothetical protein